MFRQLIIIFTILLISSVSLAGELVVGSRLSLKEGFKITKTVRSDYLLLNDVEVFLAPCKVYVFREPSQSFTTRLRTVYVNEYNVKDINYYKNAGWHLERVIPSTSTYMYMPNFYAKKVFVVERISKTNKYYIRVTDRSDVKYVFLLPKNIDDTFNVMD